MRGADIVTTVTADKTNATILTPEMIEPGMHINGVGGDCPGKTEMHRGVLEAAKVFVEFEPQSRIEGDLQQMPAEFPVTEFWRVLKGLSAGRDSEAQITFFDSVGFALEDFSALRLLRDLAAASWAWGQDVSLIPQMADPKDLFGQLGLSPAAAQAAGLSLRAQCMSALNQASPSGRRNIAPAACSARRRLISVSTR